MQNWSSSYEGNTSDWLFILTCLVLRVILTYNRKKSQLKFSGSNLLPREDLWRVILVKSDLLLYFKGGKAILFAFFVQSIIAQAWLEPSLLHVSASVDLVFS